MAGGQFKGEVLGLGVWGEGAYHWPAGKDRFLRFCFGMDYTLTSQTYALVEYFHNSAGRSGDYEFDAWLQLAAGDISSLGQNYLFASLIQPVFGFHRLGLSALANLGDRSLAVLPSVYLGLGDNVELSLFGAVSLGGDRTEFGGAGANGVMVRVSVYF